MLGKEKMERLNYLAKKKKQEKLSPQESVEQEKLREEYLVKFRSQFKKQLDNIDVEYVD